MIQKIRSWLVRHRDQTAVSYNRFGRPGEDEEEDKPSPTAIYVAPFNENAPEFMLFNVCHVQKAAVYFACFGMSMVVLSFVSTFFEFQWYHHSRGVDVTTLLGLFFFLGLGVLTHYYVIHGVRKGRARFLLPFIGLYSVMCSFELFMCAAIFFKAVEPNATVSSKSGIAVQHPPFAVLLLGMLFVLGVQAVMLLAVVRCRRFLSLRELHAMALNVAEKSRQDYPSIQILMASGGAASAAANNTSQATGDVDNSIVSAASTVVVPNGRPRETDDADAAAVSASPANGLPSSVVHRQQNGDDHSSQQHKQQTAEQPILMGIV